MIPDVLASRYASSQMSDIWSQTNKIILERKLWVAVMKAQQELGLNIPASNIADYEKVIEKVDLESIRKREEKTRHDVKARIEEFNALAGHEDIHKGLTSRDLTENIEQLQIKESLKLVHDKTVATLSHLAKLATQYSDLAITGRSHNIAAQSTTLGKRFASAAEESYFDHTNKNIYDVLGKDLDLTKITFRREILDSTTKKVINYSNFDMHLTDDEIEKLKQAL